MNARKIVYLMACFWVILLASTATAGSNHSHSHMHSSMAISDAPSLSQTHKVASPFEVKLADNGIHCKLLGHNPLIPCPHHKVPAGGEKDCYLSNECGGSPFQAPSSQSVGKYPRFLIPVATSEDNSMIAMNVFNGSVVYDSTYIHSLDRPPRAL